MKIKVAAHCIYVLFICLILLLVVDGLKVIKKFISLTGWWIFTETYKLLHIFAEKLSRHARRVMPE